MNYEEAVAYIHGRYGLGAKNGLHNMENILARLGDPRRGAAYVHVAGTNGKGSVCAYIERVLREAGLRTGMYTSPFLERYNERVRVNGAPIADDDLARDATDVRAAAEAMEAAGEGKATVFELGTALALLHFQRAKVDIAVIEVGMGGRQDVTNVITPRVSVIARIGLDHMKVLGDTIEKIAADKAGIAKRGVPCVLYPQGEDAAAPVREACARVGAPLTNLAEYAITRGEGHAFGIPALGFEGVRVSLEGEHQIYNAATALAALSALKAQGFAITDEAVCRGFADTAWPGRLEWVNGVLLDGAHNMQALDALCAYMEHALEGKRVAAVVGMMADKDVDGMTRRLAPRLAYTACVRPDSHRACEPGVLKARFDELGVRSGAFDGLRSALDAANTEGDVVVVCGSLYLAGAARTLLRAEEAGEAQG